MTPATETRSIEVYNSVGGAAFFQRLISEWKNAGAEVTCHEAISDAAYRVRRGAMGRLLLRWQMYAGQTWSCWRKARRRPDRAPLRVVTTNPFFAPALVASAAGNDGATINLLYDLFPEALIEAGKITSDSWTARRCAAVTRYALSRCSATVFLGERLRKYVESAHGPARRAVVIPVGADGGPFRNSPPTLLDADLSPQILYSGQMGRMHDVATLLHSWAKGEVPGLRWAFYATGAGYATLRQATGARPAVTWGESLPADSWQRAMLESQVALVTIASGAERVVMPSKTYSAMVAGQAILAICRRESDLADLVTRHDCGWVVEPGDVEGLNQTLSVIANDPLALLAKRQRAFEAGHRYYDMAPVSKLWMNLFDELSLGTSRHGS